jgi:hypothetical protein
MSFNSSKSNENKHQVKPINQLLIIIDPISIKPIVKKIIPIANLKKENLFLYNVIHKKDF